MPPQQLDIEEIQLREVQAITTRIYSPTTTTTTSSTDILLEECVGVASKQRATKWLDDDDDELMPSSTSRSLAQPTRRITPDNTPLHLQTIPQH